MKKLLLIRHAKATHEDGYSDFERPLTGAGIQGAESMAERLLEQGIIPQSFFTSPSLRTHSTANIFSEKLKLGAATIIKEIYDAADSTLIRVINGLPEDQDFVALVGHNPSVSQVLFTLTNDLKDVPPGTVALIEFDVDSWQEITEDTGKITYYDNPKL